MTDNCRIYLVRHGETHWNNEGRIQGQTDNPLNETGVMQAELLANKFDNYTFKRAYSSDLERAYQTAKIIADQHNLPVLKYKELREKFYGDLEGLHYHKADEMTEDDSRIFHKLSFEEKMDKKVHPTVESNSEMINRFLPRLSDISKNNKGENVLVVAHAGIISLMLLHLKKFEFYRRHQFQMDNTCYVVIDSDGEDFKISEMNGINLDI